MMFLGVYDPKKKWLGEVFAQVREERWNMKFTKIVDIVPTREGKRIS